MATLALGHVVQAFPPEKDKYIRKKKSPPATLSAYDFLNSRLSQVKSLGIKILQVLWQSGICVWFLVANRKNVPPSDFSSVRPSVRPLVVRAFMV